MSPSRPFRWADDSFGPIDTTPVNLPRPPEPLIDAAARAVPPILADVNSEWNYDEVSLVASDLVQKLVKQGHTRPAASWAVHRLVGEGKLLAKPAYDEARTHIRQTGTRGIPGLKADTRHTEVTGGGHSVRSIPTGRPAPYDSFRVVATEALWNWWREPPTAQAIENGLRKTGGEPPAGEDLPSSGVAIGGQPAQTRGNRITKDEANVAARDYLAVHAKKRLVTAEELRKAIGCSKGLVSSLPVWKAYQEQLKKNKPSAPRAVSLTDRTLAGEGRMDEELQRLIEEQKEDDTAERRRYRQRRKP